MLKRPGLGQDQATPPQGSLVTNVVAWDALKPDQEI